MVHQPACSPRLMNVPPRSIAIIWFLSSHVRTVLLLAVSGRIGRDGQSRFGPTAALLRSGSLPAAVQVDGCHSLSPGYQ
jgi:hypothetical protein